MIKKSRVACLICETAGITRKKPSAEHFSKEEMLKLYAWVSQTEKELKRHIKKVRCEDDIR